MSAGLLARGSVASLLAEHGRAATVTVSTPGTYDPAEGQSASSADTTFTGRVRVGDYRDFQIDGQNVMRGDRRATFQPTDWTKIPAKGHKVTVGSDTYKVEDVRTRELSGDVICYTLQLRR